MYLALGATKPTANLDSVYRKHPRMCSTRPASNPRGLSGLRRDDQLLMLLRLENVERKERPSEMVARRVAKLQNVIGIT